MRLSNEERTHAFDCLWCGATYFGRIDEWGAKCHCGSLLICRPDGADKPDWLSVPEEEREETNEQILDYARQCAVGDKGLAVDARMVLVAS